MTLADRLIYLLERLDMTQTELADKVGISKQSLYKYLHCKCEPRAEIIARMAVTLNTTADFIVCLTDDPSPRTCDRKTENAASETVFIKDYKKLSKENRMRVLERMATLLEEQTQVQKK